MPQIIRTAGIPFARWIVISLWDRVCFLQNNLPRARGQLLRLRTVNNTGSCWLSPGRSSLGFTSFAEQFCFFTLRNSTDFISKCVWGPWGLAQYDTLEAGAVYRVSGIFKMLPGDLMIPQTAWSSTNQTNMTDVLPEPPVVTTPTCPPSGIPPVGTIITTGIDYWPVSQNGMAFPTDDMDSEPSPI